MSEESEEPSNDELRELLNDALNLQPEELKSYNFEVVDFQIG